MKKRKNIILTQYLLRQFQLEKPKKKFFRIQIKCDIEIAKGISI